MSIIDERRSEEPEEEHLAVSDYQAAHRQRRQMLLALSILFVALILVLVKDWQFWFPSDSSAEATPAPQVRTESAKLEPATEAPQSKEVSKSAPAARASAKRTPPPVAVPKGPAPEAMGPSIIATQRKVLPPLEVEVVAGSKRRTLQPKNNTVKVDLQSEAAPVQQASSTTMESVSKLAEDVSTSVHMSAETAQMVATPVEPSYPLLAKQMKVQGAVVLQALIGKGGSIDDLHVLSGPAILSSAAMEAVKQWRFKPYFQEGRAMDTEARITVNFTISTF